MHKNVLVERETQNLLSKAWYIFPFHLPLVSQTHIGLMK